MLPDYDLESRRDPAMEQEALKIINQVIEVAEKDILVLLRSGFDVGISLARAARGFLLQTVESVAERHQQHPLSLPDLFILAGRRRHHRGSQRDRDYAGLSVLAVLVLRANPHQIASLHQANVACGRCDQRAARDGVGPSAAVRGERAVRGDLRDGRDQLRERRLVRAANDVVSVNEDVLHRCGNWTVFK